MALFDITFSAILLIIRSIKISATLNNIPQQAVQGQHKNMVSVNVFPGRTPE